MSFFVCEWLYFFLINFFDDVLIQVSMYWLGVGIVCCNVEGGIFKMFFVVVDVKEIQVIIIVGVVGIFIGGMSELFEVVICLQLLVKVVD